MGVKFKTSGVFCDQASAKRAMAKQGLQHFPHYFITHENKTVSPVFQCEELEDVTELRSRGWRATPIGAAIARAEGKGE